MLSRPCPNEVVIEVILAHCSVPLGMIHERSEMTDIGLARLPEFAQFAAIPRKFFEAWAFLFEIAQRRLPQQNNAADQFDAGKGSQAQTRCR
jgi:hypothetical protein